ncbi:MAG: guanylate kinase [Lactobacillaceae bacterium]|jgi:guanylate kinase|nr:guanylate kinase [Lactobacillaceae bacterium]
MENKVFVLTGNTGTGKTTVANYLLSQHNVPKVITHTTRPPRYNEQDGIDYYFEDATSFAKNRLLESVEYSGAQYGSSWEGLERGWQHSPLISIVIDTAGAITYARELGEQAVIIYLTVTDATEIVERLIERGDNADAVKKRLDSTEFKRDLAVPVELGDQAYVIINDDWSTTKNQIDQIYNDIYAI